MPYKEVSDLPEKIRHVLPEHAQKIYMKAYNNAVGEYKDAKKRARTEDSLEKVAHKVAWAAVKKKYKKEKDIDAWIEK